jgi:hypothetical protein
LVHAVCSVLLMWKYNYCLFNTLRVFFEDLNIWTLPKQWSFCKWNNKHNVTWNGVFLYVIHSRFCKLSILCKDFELFTVIIFYSSKASTKVFLHILLYRERHGTVHPFSVCVVTQLHVAYWRRFVKWSVFSLCDLHWCVAKFDILATCVRAWKSFGTLYVVATSFQ